MLVLALVLVVVVMVLCGRGAGGRVAGLCACAAHPGHLPHVVEQLLARRPLRPAPVATAGQ